MHALLAGVAQAIAGCWPEHVERRTAQDLPPAAADGCRCVECEQWQRIPAIFGLDPIETAVLAAAVAGDLDPWFGEVYARLSPGRTGGARHRPTAAMVAQLARIEPAQLHLVLHPHSALPLNGLAQLTGAGPLPARVVQPADRLVAHLGGAGRTDPLVESLRVDAVPVPQSGTEDLAAALREGARFGYIQQRTGTAGISAAAAVAADLGLGAVVVDLTRMPEPDGYLAVLTAVVREAGLTGAVAVVAGLQVLDEELIQGVDLLMRAAVPVLGIGELRWKSTWHRVAPPVLVAAPLAQAARRELWLDLLDSIGAPPPEESELDTLAGLQITPEQILATGRVVLRPGGRAESIGAVGAASPAAESPSLSAVLTAAREITQVEHSGAVVRRVTTARLDDLVLPEETFAAVAEVICWARLRERVLLRDRRVLGKAAKGAGLLAMFSGPAGTGKTLAAEVVATELGLDLQAVDLSVLVSKYIGETEKNLEEVFRHAEQNNCGLFFDEADALFGARTVTTDARDRYANQEIAYLLQRLESFDGLALLATNLPGNLDQAFQRRFHFMVRFAAPNQDIRRRLWRAHLDVVDLDPHDPADLTELAGWEDLAGGDIRNIVLAAVFAATAEHRQVGMDSLRRAHLRERRMRGRRV